MTVEYVIWMVAMTIMLMVSTDTSMLLYKHAQLYDVSRDAARAVATGSLTTAETPALLARFSSPSDYALNVADDGTYVTATVTIEFADVLIFGNAFLTGRTLEGRVIMAKEA
ncbi:TadE/TadG family type IV pilus assembly protein [Jannaschia sp. KMU-145]|uniref:TadE/TadG family type IV pilus assembly protein n=1 Tax=Jannaschia halovivens TaxID=3388667 RepID=UPI00396B2351